MFEVSDWSGLWQKRLSNLFSRIDNAELGTGWVALIIAAALVLVSFPFAWNGNEENYMLLARQWVLPQTHHTYDAVFDQSTGRAASFWLIGNINRLLGIALGHLFLNLMSIALYAGGLAKLLRASRLSAVDGLVVVAAFTSCGQAIIGGEWLFGGVETKTFAYGFVLLALAAALENRPIVLALCGAAACYCHFLVGGFWSAAALVCLYVNSRDVRGTAKGTLLFVALVSPLLATLVYDQLRTSALRPPGMPSANYMYALRNQHHVAPFGPGEGWELGLARGMVICGVLIAFAAGIARGANKRLKALCLLLALLAGYLVLASVVAWFDRNTSYLAKFYLFRPSSLTLLLALTVGVAKWRDRTKTDRGTRIIPIAVLVTIFAVVAPSGALNQHEPWPDKNAREMVAAVRHLTRPTDVVLIDPATDDQPGLTMMLNRQTVVSWKFIPTNNAELYRWWGLIEARKRAFAGDCSAILPAAAYLVESVEHGHDAERCGRAIWSNQLFTLIALRRQTWHRAG